MRKDYVTREERMKGLEEITKESMPKMHFGMELCLAIFVVSTLYYYIYQVTL